jgi:hypothetical protein
MRPADRVLVEGASDEFGHLFLLGICLSTVTREGPSKYHLHDAKYAGETNGYGFLPEGAWS